MDIFGTFCDGFMAQ